MFPEPDREMIVVPATVPEMSKVPLFMRRCEWTIVPESVLVSEFKSESIKASVTPELTVVVPV